MRKKNWIEFNNSENLNEKEKVVDNIKFDSRIHITKKKKGKKGKIVTIISGLNLSNEKVIKELLKDLKMFCGTGGTINHDKLQLQGDMIEKVKNFLRKDGYQI